MVALDNADAGERLLEAAGDFGIDRVALLEDGAHFVEAEEHGDRDADDDGERQHREQRAGAEENGQGEDGGEQAAEEIDQAGTDEVAQAFDVVHDAGDELAGLVLVEVGHGQAADVDLDFAAHVGDDALGGFGQNLADGKGTGGLDDGGGNYGGHQRHQHFVIPFADDVIDQVLGGGRQDEAGTPGNDDEDDTDEELAAEGPDDLPEVREDGAEAHHFRWFRSSCHI